MARPHWPACFDFAAARCRWRPAATTNRHRGWHGICVCVRAWPSTLFPNPIDPRTGRRSKDFQHLSVVVLAGDQLASSAARVGRPEPSERVVCKPIPSHPIQSRPDHAHHFFRESSLPPSCVAVGPTCRQGQRRPLTRRPWARRRRSRRRRCNQPCRVTHFFRVHARSARTHDNPVLFCYIHTGRATSTSLSLYLSLLKYYYT